MVVEWKVVYPQPNNVLKKANLLGPIFIDRNFAITFERVEQIECGLQQSCKAHQDAYFGFLIASVAPINAEKERF